MPEVKVITDAKIHLTTKQLIARIAEAITLLEPPEHGWYLDYVVRPAGKITIEIDTM